MSLSVKSLTESGAFTGAPVEREIKWMQKGKEHKATTFVRPLSYNSAVSDIRSASTNGDPVAGRIAACIVDEKGAPVFTVDDILHGPKDSDGNHMGALDAGLTMALLQVISEVTGLGETPAS